MRGTPDPRRFAVPSAGPPGLPVRHSHASAGGSRRERGPRPPPLPPPPEPPGDPACKGAAPVGWTRRLRSCGRGATWGPGGSSGARGLLQTLLMGMRPLCSAQYEKIFNTTRVPGIQIGESPAPPPPPGAGTGVNRVVAASTFSGVRIPAPSLPCCVTLGKLLPSLSLGILISKTGL